VAKVLSSYEKENSYLEEYSYTRYYPSPYYEYDTRGVTTINVPFNGKVVATIKYSNGKDLTEISFAHNNFQRSPVILTDMNASTTEVIKRDAWGK
jgi:hypothetical protein